MGRRGETNLGELVRRRFAGDSYAIGFGTHRGTVAAASDWGGPMRLMSVRPSHEDSYERICHESGVRAFTLPLRDEHESTVRSALLPPRLQRAIGVIYRPETEMLSHYFEAVLPAQFDEYVWIEETSAIRPFEVHEVAGMPETYPFGL
jgi:protein-L-isoaspartate(D-aspartate) O-methyltransferase